MSITNESYNKSVLSCEKNLSQVEMTSFHISSGKDVALEEIAYAARHHQPVTVDAGVINRVTKSRDILEKMVSDDRVIYGVNTSMGGSLTILSPLLKPMSYRTT